MLFWRPHRHLQRLRVIANVFAKHGFGFLFDYLGLTDLVSLHKRRTYDDHRLSRGERICLVFEELGATFIKLGQILSARGDLLPMDIVKALERLQDSAAPLNYVEIDKVIIDNLGDEANKIFQNFEKEPLASASIGQVHRANLATGEPVVVKVQRPDIHTTVETDLEILFDLARIAERKTSLGERYELVDMANEFARSIRCEMDFRTEGQNADRFRANFSGDPRICIPAIFWEYSTSTVLTMERLEGKKLGCLASLDDKGYDRPKLARNLANIIVKQILVDGFFHADPHPGNIFVLENGVLGLLDFGMVGILSEERKGQLAAVLFALIQGSTEGLMHTVFDMGVVPPGVNRQKFKIDLGRLRQKYYSSPIEEITIGVAFNDFLELTYTYSIKLPTEFILLAKCLVTTEGIVRELDPHLSMMEVVSPFARTLVMRQFSLKNIKRVVQGSISEYKQMLSDIPSLVRVAREKMEEPEMRGVIRCEGFERVLCKLDQITNRLSFSVILLAFSIIMAGLMIATSVGFSSGSVITRLPVFEVGFFVGALMFLWIIISILRSGRF